MTINVSIPEPDQSHMLAAKDALETAKGWVITTQAECDAALDEVKAIKRKHKELEAMRKHTLKPVDETRARIQALFKPPLDYLQKAEYILKGLIVNYQDAEAERLRKEQEELVALAEQCGEKEVAEDFRRQDVAPVKAEGAHTVTRWHAELVDIKALCAAVAAGDVSADLVQLDQAAANRVAAALKDAVQCPGLKFVATKSMAVRA